MSARRLRGPEFVTVMPGLCTPATAPAALSAMCHALQRKAVPGAVISHTTAAVLYGWPLPYWVDGGVGLLVPELEGRERRRLRRPLGPEHQRVPLVRSCVEETSVPAWISEEEPRVRAAFPPTLHCRVTGDGRRGAGPHVIVHRMRAEATLTWGGLVLSHPFVVLLELAGMLGHDELVIVIDHLLGPMSLISGVGISALERAVASFAGRPGVARLAAALGDARCDVESPGETRTRLLLVRAGFPEPTPNLRVLDPITGGERRIDNGYPALRIGAEYQGDVHRTARSRWREDQARADCLAAIGWRLRFLTWTDIGRPRRFLSAMRRTFLAVGAPAPSPDRWEGPAELDLARPLRPREGGHRR